MSDHNLLRPQPFFIHILVIAIILSVMGIIPPGPREASSQAISSGKAAVTDNKSAVRQPPPSSVKSGSSELKTGPAVKGTSAEEKKKVEDERKKREDLKKKKEQEKEEKTVKWIEKTLEFGIQQDRMEAMNAIVKLKNPENRLKFGNTLRDILKEEIDIDVRMKAINIVGQLKLKDALPELVESLKDESEDIKLSAVYSIKRIDDKSVAEKLIEQLKAQDMKKQSNYSEALIDTLGAFKAAQLKDFAVAEIKKDTTNDSLRQFLVLFLGRVEARDTKDFLLGLAKDEGEDVTMRAYAINSLGRMQIKESGPEIDKIIKEVESYPFKKRQTYYRLYIYSVAALARMGDERVFPRLVHATRSNNEQVRLQAVRLIKEIKGKRTIDILEYKKKHDPSPRVQRAATEALAELGVEGNDTPGSDDKDDGKKDDESEK